MSAQLNAPASAGDIETMASKLNSEIFIETKIRLGAENMLQVQQSSTRGDSISRKEVLEQLSQANQRIEMLSKQLEHLRPTWPEISQNADESRSKIRDRVGSSPAQMMTPVHQVSAAELVSSLRANRRRSANARMNASASQLDLQPLVVSPIQEILASLQISSKHPYVRLENLNKLVEYVRGDLDTNIHTESIAQLLYHFASSALHLATTLLYYSTDVRTSYDLHLSIWPYLFDSVKEVRAAALRTLRHLSRDPKSIALMTKLPVDLVLAKFLTKDKNDLEREQTIQLIRTWINLQASDAISTLLVRTLVSIAEHVEDRLRLLAIETLCELALVSPKTVAVCGGIKTIVQSLPDLPRELVNAVVMTILILLDTPDTRCYFRRGVEVETIISAFSNSHHAKGKEYDDRLAAYYRALLPFLRHWTGIIYLSLDGRRAVKAFVDSIRLPSSEVKMRILDLLLQIFRVKSRTVCGNNRQSLSRQSMRRILTSQHITSTQGNRQTTMSSSSSNSLNVLEHYTGLLLIIFIESNLFEALIDVIGESAKDISSKATYLIRELIDRANCLLPDPLAINVQSLPGLFSLASSFRLHESSRHNAIAALSHIDQQLSTFSINHNSYLSATAGVSVQQQSQKRQVEQTKLKLGLIIDDANFRNMILDSGVLSWGVRDHRNWNWEAIGELFQGPLRNPKRLEELLRTTDFVLRVLDFYRPNKSFFSDMIITHINTNYIKIGCIILTTLATHADGVELLCKHSLLDEVARSLSEVDMHTDKPDSEYIFSAANLEKTLAVGYFTLVGSLMTSREGTKILERVHFFSLLYYASEATNREDLLRTIVLSLDYSMPGHSRTLIEKIATSSLATTRLFATHHLHTLIRKAEKEMSDWLISLLVNQLYDPAPRVIHAACRALDEACEAEENLATLVRLQPSLDHVLGIEDSLVLRFLSSNTGFRYLASLGYIEQQMEYWFKEGIYLYVEELEKRLWQNLAKNDLSTSAFERGRYDDIAVGVDEEEVLDECTQPHFYGELTKTEEGYGLLKNKGHFQIFVNTIKGGLQADETDTKQLKAFLWTIGCIGSTKLGYQLLEQENLVASIINIAEHSETISVRGTCFHVLGLISKSPKGWEALQAHNWHSKLSEDGVQGSGICIPQNTQSFFELPHWEHLGSSSLDLATHLSVVQATSDETEKQIIQAIYSIANHISANTAINTLHRLRVDSASYFTCLPLYVKALHVLSNYHYRFTAHKFVQELFDQADISNVEALRAAQNDIIQARQRQAKKALLQSKPDELSELSCRTDMNYDADVADSVRSQRSRRQSYYPDNSPEDVRGCDDRKPLVTVVPVNDIHIRQTITGFVAM